MREQCKLCSFTYPRGHDGTRMYHLRSIHGYPSIDYACTFPGCEKSFISSRQLATHAFVHTDERPHLCSHAGCSFAAKMKRSLTIHTQRMHRGNVH
jgi:uncharacterized Zn-finger protein